MAVGIVNERDLDLLKYLLEEYEGHSGSSLNWSKCETLHLGQGVQGISAAGAPYSKQIGFGQIVKEGDAVCYLGVFLSKFGSTLSKDW